MKGHHPERQGILRRFRWGLLPALLYVVTAVVSYLFYQANRHEYSIPLFVFVYSSYPVYLILLEVLQPIRSWAYSEALMVSLIVLFSAILYLAIGQAMGHFLRNIIRGAGKTETRSARNKT